MSGNDADAAPFCCLPVLCGMVGSGSAVSKKVISPGSVGHRFSLQRGPIVRPVCVVDQSDELSSFDSGWNKWERNPQGFSVGLARLLSL